MMLLWLLITMVDHIINHHSNHLYQLIYHGQAAPVKVSPSMVAVTAIIDKIMERGGWGVAANADGSGAP